MWSWWSKEGGRAGGEGLGRKVLNFFLCFSQSLCIFWFTFPDTICICISLLCRILCCQVQHDLRWDECEGQHRGGAGDRTHLQNYLFLICRLSWSWLTECFKVQASGAPDNKDLPRLLQHKLGLLSSGEPWLSPPLWKLKFQSSGLNKEEHQVRRLAVEPRWKHIGCVFIFLHFTQNKMIH